MGSESRDTRRRERQSNPWLPLFGFISLVVFGAFSWYIAPILRPIIVESTGFEFPTDMPQWVTDAVLAFVVFVVLFAFAMTVVGLLAGRTGDPRDVRTSSREMKKQQKRQRRRN